VGYILLFILNDPAALALKKCVKNKIVPLPLYCVVAAVGRETYIFTLKFHLLSTHII
jgi:hypothetical protein